jgi:hypothetical protein
MFREAAAAKISLIELMGLDHRPHSAVKDKNSFFQQPA